MKKLFFHLGHSKTGSSFLQSLFSINVRVLEENGISYPDHLETPALRGEVSIGNGAIFLTALGEPERPAESRFLDYEKDVLFSSEWLFEFLCPSKSPMFREVRPWPSSWDNLSEEERLDAVVTWAERNGFGEIRVLLFIRDPVEHFLALDNQVAKIGEKFRPHAEKILLYDYPQRVALLLKVFGKRSPIHLEIRNYSKIRRNLREEVEEWLGARCLLPKSPSRATVNRSLTVSERILQCGLNFHLGNCSEIIAFPLCNELPNIEVELPCMAMADQDRLRELVGTAVGSINEKLPSQHAYDLDVVPTPSDTAVYQFSKAQLDLIGDRIGRVIKMQRDDVEQNRKLLEIAQSRAEENFRAFEKNETLLAVAQSCAEENIRTLEFKSREILKLRHELQSVLESRSWKWTAPLRRLLNAVTHLARRGG